MSLNAISGAMVQSEANAEKLRESKRRRQFEIGRCNARG